MKMEVKDINNSVNPLLFNKNAAVAASGQALGAGFASLLGQTSMVMDILPVRPEVDVKPEVKTSSVDNRDVAADDKKTPASKADDKQNAASAEDLEDAEDAYETAKSKVTELDSTIKETEISLSTAETNLGYTKITAPLDGTIVSVPVKQGQTINAAMDTPTIVQIADLSQMEILIEISEGDISNIKPGVKVTYSILGDLNNIYETTLKSIDPGLTLLTNNEYTEVVGSDEAIYYYGRLVVPNDRGVLRIGMTTQNVIYEDSAEDVLTVPATAIKNEGQGKFVEILTKNGVEKRSVVTGVSDGLNIEVKSGVKEGEEAVLAKMSSAEISDKTSKIRGPRGF